jgi:DNA-binding MarR family transcriptional regulator
VEEKDGREFFEQIVALSRFLRGAAAQSYATFEVGSTQAKFLRHIPREGGMSQADLARATDTAPTLTGRALETLIERGWVRRKRSQEDRRQYMLELTVTGQRARDKVDEARLRIVDRIGAVLDERDAADFERIAAKIRAALASQGAEPPPQPQP